MNKNYFWGIGLVLIAAYLIVSRLGFLPAVGVFTVLATIVCVAAFIQSLIHKSFGGMLFSLAFIGILYDEQLGITMLTPWTILGAALLGTIGLNLIFPHRVWKKLHTDESYGKHEAHFDSTETVDGENVCLKASFCSQIRYVTSDNLKYADIKANFSGMKIYFDNARIPSGSAVLDMDVSFAGVELFVPADWTVINHLDSSFGGVSEKGKTPTKGASSLTLEGRNSFSGITIIYI